MTETMTTVTESAARQDYAPRQAELALRYQQALRRAAGERRAVDADGLDALTELVSDLTPLLRKVVAEKVRLRFGCDAPRQLHEDCYASMVEEIVKAAGEFDPVRCASFHSWVTGRQGPARKGLHACLDAAAGLDNLDERSRRALGIARKAEASLRAKLDRSPSTAELQAEMWKYCYRYQFELLSAEQQQLPEPAWREIARSKLVNNSMNRCIRDIDELRKSAGRLISSEEFATGWDSVDSTHSSADADDEERDSLVDFVTVALSGLSETDKKIVAARLSPGRGDDATVAAVADRFGVPATRVKELVASATARMLSSHAHFAFLAPGVSSQFEEPPVQGATGVTAVLNRLRPTLV